MKKICITGFLAMALAVHAQDGLKDVLGEHFLIGTSLNQWQSAGWEKRVVPIVRKHFNSVVAENCMKPEALQPTESVFTFKVADELMEFARRNGQSVVGHCLVWHSQTPPWFFTDKEGKPATREQLIARIRSHIHTVVGRYKGQVRGWDVVNEAFEDDGSWRRSPFYRIIGEDFIEIAFKAAHEADPDAELYYNDYSMSAPGRRDAVCRLVRRLKAAGCRIDAVGMQSHCGLDYPNLKAYEASIDSFAACGVKVMITELDLNILPAPENFSGAAIDQNFAYGEKLDPYTKGLPDSVASLTEKRYLELFDIYRRHSHQISRVNLWGISDGDSWLNNWPIQGRTSYPLLFDRMYQEKPIIHQIINLFK